MKVTLALLADYANVSADGKLNIMGIFDTIWVDRFPAVHPQMQLIMRLEASPAEAGSRRKLEIKLMTADGRQVLSVAAELGFELRDALQPIGETMRADHIITLGNLRFDAPGDYQFAILVNDDEKSTVPVKARLRQQPTSPA
ncbi:MAG: hypothetical protein Q8Q58_10445 [Candidatus Rokubacteria bacterium]|nr:hypothetical protein [Candidatus Rokubacteria bacterium]